MFNHTIESHRDSLMLTYNAKHHWWANRNVHVGVMKNLHTIAIIEIRLKWCATVKCSHRTPRRFRLTLLPAVLTSETFQFLSRRHRGFPFSLTFFLNGLQAERLSSCCEFKHRRGPRLGGRHGHFGFSAVERASPCYKWGKARFIICFLSWLYIYIYFFLIGFPN